MKTKEGGGWEIGGGVGTDTVLRWTGGVGLGRWSRMGGEIQLRGGDMEPDGRERQGRGGEWSGRGGKGFEGEQCEHVRHT